MSGAYLVDLTLECDHCKTRLEIRGQPGAAPLAAYEQFVSDHAHPDDERRREETYS